MGGLLFCVLVIYLSEGQIVVIQILAESRIALVMLT